VAAQQPQLRPALAKVLQSGALEQALAEAFDQVGFATDNLADVMAGYFIMAWSVVTGGDERQFPDGMLAVRDRMRRALAANTDFAALGNAQKQKMAQILGD